MTLDVAVLAEIRQELLEVMRLGYRLENYQSINR